MGAGSPGGEGRTHPHKDLKKVREGSMSGGSSFRQREEQRESPGVRVNLDV